VSGDGWPTFLAGALPLSASTSCGHTAQNADRRYVPEADNGF
jgi:hypothetical protein